MKLLKVMLLYSLFFISIYKLYGQKTKVTPNTIELTKSGLDAKSIFISSKENIISSSIFKYGQQISINLNEIKGLTKIDGKYYPNIDLILVSKKGDTIFHKSSLYGLDLEVKENSKNSLNIPLLPYYPMLLINGIHSGEEYTMLCAIRDTKSRNRLNIKLDFKVIPNQNPHLIIKKKGIDFSEGFLFSENSRNLLIDNIIEKNEYLILTFKDIKNYTIRDDKIAFNINYSIVDESNKTLVSKVVYLTSKCENGKILNPNIKIPFNMSEVKDFDLDGVLTLNIKISDRNSNSQITVVTKLFII